MYSSFAHDFSRTRNKPWPCVEKFLQKHKEKRLLLEVGCGNGRNLIAAKEYGYICSGIDICPEFVSICKARDLDVKLGTIGETIQSTYDTILCIAVLHHIESAEDRLQCIQNMYDALNPGGALCLTVWSYETAGAMRPKKFNIGDNHVPWKNKDSRYYYIYDRTNLDMMINTFQTNNSSADISVSWEEQNWIVEICKRPHSS